MQLSSISRWNASCCWLIENSPRSSETRMNTWLPALIPEPGAAQSLQGWLPKRTVKFSHTCQLLCKLVGYLNSFHFSLFFSGVFIFFYMRKYCGAWMLQPKWLTLSLAEVPSKTTLASSKLLPSIGWNSVETPLFQFCRFTICDKLQRRPLSIIVALLGNA